MQKRLYPDWVLFIILLMTGTTFSNDSTKANVTTANYVYRRTIGETVDTVYRSLITSASDVVITYNDPANTTSRALCDDRFRIHSWQFEDKETGFDVIVKRRGDTIIITGKQRTKALQKLQAIDSLPWYQAMEFSLLSFLKQGENSCEFWMIRPTDMKAFKMIARLKENESSRR